jgi:hypothetical protein
MKNPKSSCSLHSRRFNRDRQRELGDPENELGFAYPSRLRTREERLGLTRWGVRFSEGPTATPLRAPVLARGGAAEADAVERGEHLRGLEGWGAQDLTVGVDEEPRGRHDSAPR